MDAISSAITAAEKKLPLIERKLDEPMKNHTSFRVGGPVRAMYFPENAEALTELHMVFRQFGVKPLTIGNGTNLLVSDEELDIVVISTKRQRRLEQTGETEITADAGVSLSELAMFALECSLTGAGFTYGIPGSVGGAVVMDAGAYGGEMRDIVHSTTAFAHDTGMYTVIGAEHAFGYRGSRFSETDDVILRSCIHLQRGDKSAIKAEMDEQTVRRCKSQPLELPSAGSTFKRPDTGYAAALIEKAGLKGFSIGGARVSDKHAGFIVNQGGATFDEVIGVIEHVKATVARQFDVKLETEVKIIR